MGETHGAVDIVGIFLFFLEYFKGKNVLPADSLLGGVPEHGLQHLLDAGSGEFLGEPDNFFVDFGDQLLERGGFVGGFSVEHLVEDNAHGPDVAFGGVGASVEDFGAHVHGTAD